MQEQFQQYWDNLNIYKMEYDTVCAYCGTHKCGRYKLILIWACKKTNFHITKSQKDITEGLVQNCCNYLISYT